METEHLTDENSDKEDSDVNEDGFKAESLWVGVEKEDDWEHHRDEWEKKGAEPTFSGDREFFVESKKESGVNGNSREQREFKVFPDAFVDRSEQSDEAVAAW